MKPIRKNLRLKNYDYSSAGAYFVTVCVRDRAPVLWQNGAVGAAISRPLSEPPLSPLGKLVRQGIEQIPEHYAGLTVDNYCIMPDHIHLLLCIHADEFGRQIAAPTVSTVIGHMKRWVTLQSGRPIWQKSFMERILRSEEGYRAVWEYIDANPLKMDTADDPVHYQLF